MKTQLGLGSAWALIAVACGGEDTAAPPASLPPPSPPPGFEASPLGPAAFPAVSTEGEPAFFPPGVTGLDGPPAVSGDLPVNGELQGQLRNIDLSSVTTSNAGTMELWESGGASLHLNIAATGSPWGAGMLMVSIMASDISKVLPGGYWSSDNPSADSGSVGFVSSCAGPVIGDWRWELPAIEYEMTASEDPERPDEVVLVIKGRFPESEDDYERTGPISELIGTLRIERTHLEALHREE
jgi:hypothetical protein